MRKSKSVAKNGKIIFYINTLGKGGAERVISQLAGHFSRAEFETILVTSFYKEEEYPLAEGVKRLSLEDTQIEQSRFKRNVTRIQKLRAICKKEKPDVLISFMAEPNFRAILATAGLPVKTIVSVRNDPNREYAGFFGKIVGKVLLPTADGCVFQTEEAKAWFPKRLQRKSAVIMNEVAERFFTVEREKTANVVAVGRLSKQKNHSLLLSAFARIADKFSEEKLLIYGEGICREALQQQITELGLKDRAFLMGNTSQVEEVLAQAGVFVLPSDYEGMPNALMEALAVGVPSISTDCPCGGPKALIEHEKNGLLVPVNDEDAMAEAMERLLQDRVFAEYLGTAAQNSAKKYLPVEIFMQWKQFIDGVE